MLAELCVLVDGEVLAIMRAAAFLAGESGARDQKRNLVDVNDLARTAAPGTREPFFHCLEFLDGMSHMRTHAHDSGVSPHQSADGAQQVVNVLVIGMFRLVRNRLMVSRLSAATFLSHCDSRPRSEDHTFEE